MVFEENVGVSRNGWFRMEHPVKMDDLGGTTIFGNIHVVFFGDVFLVAM